jgi:hypothetical protein
MESKDRKRPREQEDENGPNKVRAPPPYGSQEYWEERYQKLKESTKEDSDPAPFHAWYFNYEELAPLLLPLILGEGNVEDSEISEDEEAKESNLSESIEVHGENGGETEKPDTDDRGENSPKNDNNDTQAVDGSDDIENATSKEEEAGTEEDDDNENDLEAEEGQDDDELEEMYDSEEDEQEPPKRMGLAKEGPISILEVGCGDVPLGRDIAKGVQELESAVGVKVADILKQVVCTDYSKAVIKAMQEEQETESNEWKLSTPLKYEVADARKMPYQDESFELLIEKGTLDAMLSDAKMGAENCRLIVADCARVLATGGTSKTSRMAWNVSAH